MKQLRDGDRSAFTPLYEALRPLVYAYAQKSVGPTDADDVTQVALIKVFEQASEYNDAHPVMAWALAITAWECRTVLKKRARRREDFAPPPASTEASHPEADLIERLLFAKAEEVAAGLSAKDRQTLEAVLSGTGSGPTFRKRKQRALFRLKEAWRSLYG